MESATRWGGTCRESRVARTPVSVGRPSAQAPVLCCTPSKSKGGVERGVSFYVVLDVHRFYNPRVKFYLVLKIKPAVTGAFVQAKSQLVRWFVYFASKTVFVINRALEVKPSATAWMENKATSDLQFDTNATAVN